MFLEQKKSEVEDEAGSAWRNGLALASLSSRARVLNLNQNLSITGSHLWFKNLGSKGVKIRREVWARGFCERSKEGLWRKGDGGLFSIRRISE